MRPTVLRVQVEWEKTEPHGTRDVHGYPNVLRLIEILRECPRLEGIDGAKYHENHNITQVYGEAELVNFAFQD